MSVALTRQRFDASSVQASMALFRHGLRFNLPLFPTADHYSLLLPPRHVAEPLSRAGGGPHAFLACTEMLAVVGSLPSEIWWASEAQLEEAPAMADTTPPEIYPRTSHLCIIGQFLPQLWPPQIQCRAVAWSDGLKHSLGSACGAW